jgi:hypothetical protein
VKGLLGLVLAGLWEPAGAELGPPTLGHLEIVRHGGRSLDGGRRRVAASGGGPHPDHFAVAVGGEVLENARVRYRLLGRCLGRGESAAPASNDRVVARAGADPFWPAPPGLSSHASAQAFALISHLNTPFPVLLKTPLPVPIPSKVLQVMSVSLTVSVGRGPTKSAAVK